MTAKSTRRVLDSTDPAFYVERIKEVVSDFCASRGISERKYWRRYPTFYPQNQPENRSYADYGSFFHGALQDFLGRPDLTIADFIAEKAAGRDAPVPVLDDGAGTGRFQSESAALLAKKGVEVDNTALSLFNARSLAQRRRFGRISKVVIGPAELFVPDKKYAFISSLAGSVQYTMPSLRKDHFLKFAYSLEPGGVSLIGLNYFQEVIMRVWGRERAAGSGRVFNHDEWVQKSREVEESMGGIIRALEKRGFRAKLYKSPLGVPYPSHILAIQRLPAAGPTSRSKREPRGKERIKK